MADSFNETVTGNTNEIEMKQVEVAQLQQSIGLGNPMNAANHKVKYEYNYRVLFIVIIAGVLNLIANIDSYIQALDNKRRYHWASIVYCIFMLLLCIALLVISCVKGHKHLVNTLSNLLLKSYSSNNLYAISEEVDRAVLLMISGFIYTCLATVIIQAYWLDPQYESTEIRCEDQHQYHSVCLLSTASAMGAYNFSCSSLLFLMVFCSVKCDSMIEEEKQKIMDQYGNTIAIVNTINSKLQNLKTNKQLHPIRFVEYAVVFLVVFVPYTLIAEGISRRHIFSADHTTAAQSIAICFYLCDSIFVTLMLGFAHTVIYHYSFPCVIMRELSSPIAANDIRDMIGWWELRKYYNDCVINIYSFIMQWTIATFLCVSAVLITSTFSEINEHQSGGSAIWTLGGAIYVTVLTFAMVANARSYHEYQVSHLSTVNRERLQFDANELNEYTHNKMSERKLVHQVRDNIIARIRADIENNSSPISVLGVKMDDNFMLFLRATAITVCIAFVFQI